MGVSFYITEWPKDRPIRFEYQTRGDKPQVRWMCVYHNQPKTLRFRGLVEGLEDLLGVSTSIKNSSNKMKKGVDFRSGAWYIVNPSNNGVALKNAEIL